MKYLHYYPTTSEFEAIYNSKNYNYPWISVTNNSGEKVLNFNKEFTKIKILTKVNSSTYSEYTTSPDFADFFVSNEGIKGGTYSIWFNNKLFTNMTSTKVYPPTYPDQWDESIHFGASSDDETYKYHITVQVNEYGSTYQSSVKAMWLPSTLGEVGDWVEVRVEKN